MVQSSSLIKNRKCTPNKSYTNKPRKESYNMSFKIMNLLYLLFLFSIGNAGSTQLRNFNHPKDSETFLGKKKIVLAGDSIEVSMYKIKHFANNEVYLIYRTIGGDDYEKDSTVYEDGTYSIEEFLHRKNTVRLRNKKGVTHFMKYDNNDRMIESYFIGLDADVKDNPYYKESHGDTIFLDVELFNKSGGFIFFD